MAQSKIHKGWYAHLKKIGSKGGKTKWDGKTTEEKKEIMKKVRDGKLSKGE